jgi:hypothetical protein
MVFDVNYDVIVFDFKILAKYWLFRNVLSRGRKNALLLVAPRGVGPLFSG